MRMHEQKQQNKKSGKDHTKAQHHGNQHSQDDDARNRGRPHVDQEETHRLREHGGSGHS